MFEQEPVFEESKSILDNIFHHSHPVINAIKEYEAAMDSGNEDDLGNAIVAMDELSAWDFDNKVHQIFGKAQYSSSQPAGVNTCRADNENAWHLQKR